MPLAVVSTGLHPGALKQPSFTRPPLDHLRSLLKQWRQRRLDRMVAETVLALDHTGIVDDYRLARWR